MEEQWNTVWIMNELGVENKLLLRLIAQVIPIMQGACHPSKGSKWNIPGFNNVLITASQVNIPAQKGVKALWEAEQS